MLSTLKKLICLTSVAVLSSVLPIAAHAIPFSSISQVYVFGDSLSDSGYNNFITYGMPGKAPTFTTFGGYTWAQYVAHDIKGFVLPTQYPAPPYSDTITNNTTPENPGDGSHVVDPVLTGIDYACGGSTTNSTVGFGVPWAPSLVQQVQHFLATTPTVDPDALYFIWSGANDIFTALSNPNPTELQLLQTADAATTVIAQQVAALRARGAKRFVILSMTNMAYTPLILEESQVIPTLPALVKDVNYTFNNMLNQKLGQVIKTTGAKVLFIDTYTLLGNLIEEAKAGKPFVVAGKSFYFTNTTNEACGLGVSSLFCPNNGIHNYVFADDVHPSDLAHQAIALEVELQIKNWNA